MSDMSIGVKLCRNSKILFKNLNDIENIQKTYFFIFLLNINYAGTWNKPDASQVVSCYFHHNRDFSQLGELLAPRNTFLFHNLYFFCSKLL